MSSPGVWRDQKGDQVSPACKSPGDTKEEGEACSGVEALSPPSLPWFKVTPAATPDPGEEQVFPRALLTQDSSWLLKNPRVLSRVNRTLQGWSLPHHPCFSPPATPPPPVQPPPVTFSHSPPPLRPPCCAFGPSCLGNPGSASRCWSSPTRPSPAFLHPHNVVCAPVYVSDSPYAVW